MTDVFEGTYNIFGVASCCLENPVEMLYCLSAVGAESGNTPHRKENKALHYLSYFCQNVANFHSSFTERFKENLLQQ